MSRPISSRPNSTATRSSRSNPAPPSSSSNVNLNDNLTIQSDPFENLDPSLHPTLNSISSNGLSNVDLDPNRLEDLANQALKGGHDMSLDEESHDVVNAANLLAFTNGEDGGLFATSSSHPGHTPFGELLQAADQSQRVEGSGEGGEDAELHENNGHDDIFQVAHDENQLGIGGHDDDQTALGIVRATSGRGGSGRKRKLGEDGAGLMEGEDGEMVDPVKQKKDSHKEVERRRRENINDGIDQIARMLPPVGEKTGKGSLLKKAADYMGDLVEKVTRFDEELAKKESEKQELQTELTHCQTRLADEHSRSLRYETSWREAEDRAAISQFEVDRLRTELEEVKKKLSKLGG